MNAPSRACGYDRTRVSRDRLLYEMVGRRIQEVRDEHRLSRRALADLCGLSPAVIESAESGKCVPLIVVTSVAEVFDLSPAELIPLDAT